MRVFGQDLILGGLLSALAPARGKCSADSLASPVAALRACVACWASRTATAAFSHSAHSVARLPSISTFRLRQRRCGVRFPHRCRRDVFRADDISYRAFPRSWAVRATGAIKTYTPPGQRAAGARHRAPSSGSSTPARWRSTLQVVPPTTWLSCSIPTWIRRAFRLHWLHRFAWTSGGDGLRATFAPSAPMAAVALRLRALRDVQRRSPQPCPNPEPWRCSGGALRLWCSAFDQSEPGKDVQKLACCVRIAPLQRQIGLPNNL